MDYKLVLTETHLPKPDFRRAIKKTVSESTKNIPNQVELMVQEIRNDDSKDTLKIHYWKERFKSNHSCKILKEYIPNVQVLQRWMFFK